MMSCVAPSIVNSCVTRVNHESRFVAGTGCVKVRGVGAPCLAQEYLVVEQYFEHRAWWSSTVVILTTTESCCIARGCWTISAACPSNYWYYSFFLRTKHVCGSEL